MRIPAFGCLLKPSRSDTGSSYNTAAATIAPHSYWARIIHLCIGNSTVRPHQEAAERAPDLPLHLVVRVPPADDTLPEPSSDFPGCLGTNTLAASAVGSPAHFCTCSHSGPVSANFFVKTFPVKSRVSSNHRFYVCSWRNGISQLHEIATGELFYLPAVSQQIGILTSGSLLEQWFPVLWCFFLDCTGQNEDSDSCLRVLE